MNNYDPDDDLETFQSLPEPKSWIKPKENTCEEITNLNDDQAVDHIDNCETCTDYYNTINKNGAEKQ